MRLTAQTASYTAIAVMVGYIPLFFISINWHKVVYLSAWAVLIILAFHLLSVLVSAAFYFFVRKREQVFQLRAIVVNLWGIFTLVFYLSLFYLVMTAIHLP